MSKKLAKRSNILADSSADNNDADVVPPSGLEIAAPSVDLDDRVPLGQEGEPDDVENPSPAQEWRAVIGLWEAKLATLMEAFDRFMVTEREPPTVSGQSPHAPAPPGGPCFGHDTAENIKGYELTLKIASGVIPSHVVSSPKSGHTRLI
ncbi:unnamed protein product [Lampetra planeri]